MIRVDSRTIFIGGALVDVEDFDDASCLLGKLSKSLFVVECHLMKARHGLASEDLPSKPSDVLRMLLFSHMCSNVRKKIEDNRIEGKGTPISGHDTNVLELPWDSVRTS